jgi:glyoxylase-like metal-dependent hydrolase (beta-lactamase superfamily II)
MKKKFILVFLFCTAIRGVNAQQHTAEWFTVKEIFSKVWVIDDHRAVNIYLTEGKDSAMLIDTGIGAADLMSLVKSLTQKPLIVINTHGHPDHAGGNYQFSKIYVNAADSAAARKSATTASRAEAAKNMLRGAVPQENEKYKDEEKLTVFSSVDNGQIFNLGGRKLEVIATPGHTPGSICLIDKENKLLFSGDNNNTAVWLFLPESLPMNTYLMSLRTLSGRISEFKSILPGHGIPKKSDFILDQIECVKSIINGGCVPASYNTFAGKASLCQFGRASVAYDADRL